MVVSIILLVIILASGYSISTDWHLMLVVHTVYSSLIVFCGLLKVDLSSTGVLASDSVVSFSLMFLSLARLVFGAAGSSNMVIMVVIALIMSLLYIPHVLFGC